MNKYKFLLIILCIGFIAGPVFALTVTGTDTTENSTQSLLESGMAISNVGNSGIPEPSKMLLFGIMLLLFAGISKRRVIK